MGTLSIVGRRAYWSLQDSRWRSEGYAVLSLAGWGRKKEANRGARKKGRRDSDPGRKTRKGRLKLRRAYASLGSGFFHSGDYRGAAGIHGHRRGNRGDRENSLLLVRDSVSGVPDRPFTAAIVKGGGHSGRSPGVWEEQQFAAEFVKEDS